MAKLNQFTSTTERLLNVGFDNQVPRPYLGMSGLGHGCLKYQWYSFRWAYVDSVSKRMQRLFNRGHREEPVLAQYLRDIGYIVDETQQEVIDGFGHMKGHNDGTVMGVIEAPLTEHLLEYKTMKLSKFNELVKKGSVKKAQLGYYVQVQLYMYKLNLTRCLWIAVCKDNDHIYVERIKPEPGFAEHYIEKGKTVILSETPPPILPPYSPTWYECGYCSAKNICHKQAPMVKNCRTCVHAEIETEGEWSCAAHDIPLSVKMQRAGCEDRYQGIPNP